MVKQLTAEGEMDQQTDRQTGGWTEKKVARWVDGWMDDRQTDRWMERQAGRRADGWTDDRQMDR